MEKYCQIVGGGIAGLSAAIGLQKQGIKFMLFEQDQELSYDRVGLGISRNIFPILKKWEILEPTFKIGAEIKTFHFVDKNFRKIASFKMKQPALSVIRPEFHKLLSGLISKENIQFGERKLTQDLDENTITIVADGASSPIRKELYTQLKLRDSNQTLWRGIVNLKFPETFKNSYYDFIGDNLRFAIIHTGGDYYSWYAIQENASIVAKDSKKNLLSLFESFHPIVKEVIGNTELISSSVLQDIKPLDRKGLAWFNKNMVFIGDAIHPTTPNMANGACLAMEDAYVLTKLLEKNFSRDVFFNYQKLREKKVDSIVRQSWNLGKMMHQTNPLINKLFIAGTRLLPQIVFDQIYSNVLNDESIAKVNSMD